MTEENTLINSAPQIIITKYWQINEITLLTKGQGDFADVRVECKKCTQILEIEHVYVGILFMRLLSLRCPICKENEK